MLYPHLVGGHDDEPPPLLLGPGPLGADLVRDLAHPGVDLLLGRAPPVHALRAVEGQSRHVQQEVVRGP